MPPHSYYEGNRRINCIGIGRMFRRFSRLKSRAYFLKLFYTQVLYYIVMNKECVWRGGGGGLGCE